MGYTPDTMFTAFTFLSDSVNLRKNAGALEFDNVNITCYKKI